jgi:lipopolysaccharide/colanic/teichoic acid biosynthesis glycosyltransferase
MIIRSRRNEQRAFWARWFARKTPPKQLVLTEDSFTLALAKERSRCDRRDRDREFALLLVDMEDAKVAEKKLLRLCQMVRDRLRVTDEIGWREEFLCFLLPETGRDGGEKVAKTIADACFELNLKLDVQVLVYPEDDDIANKSFELEERSDNESNVQVGDEAVTSHQRMGFTAVDTHTTPYWKRGLDIFGAIVALTIFSPLFILAAIAIKLDSKGPIFFRQQREGKDGRIFEIVKFRTMRVGAEAEQLELRAREDNEQDGPAFKLTNDPRVTRIGRYLRKICLDEMPQMLNVLVGDMSMVGPRPLPVGESHGSKIWHRRRLEVLPGLTCIWQVQGRRDIEFDDWMRMDLDYIQHRSLWLDLNLLCKTAFVVVLHRGSV